MMHWSKTSQAVYFLLGRIQVCLGLGVFLLVQCCLDSNQNDPFSTNSFAQNTSWQTSNHADIGDLSTLQAHIESNLALLKNPRTRRIAAARLGALKARCAVKPLLRVVKSDKNTHFIRAALIALGNIGDSASIAGIRNMLWHADVEVRKAAIQALSRFEQKKLGEVFETLLLSNQAEIRLTTLKALRQASPQAFRSFQSEKLLIQAKQSAGAHQPQIAVEAIRLLGRFEATNLAIEFCALLSTHPSLEARLQAAEELGNVSGAQPRHCLHRASSDPNPRLACVATAGLIKQGADIPLRQLAAYLKHPDERVRFTAVSALGEIGSKPARRMIQNHIAIENDFNVRRHTIKIASILERSAH